ncbi:MAG: hypothetical protein ACFFCZ_28240 [Promethearchaeota archaeon]
MVDQPSKRVRIGSYILMISIFGGVFVYDLIRLLTSEPDDFTSIFNDMMDLAFLAWFCFMILFLHRKNNNTAS